MLIDPSAPTCAKCKFYMVAPNNPQQGACLRFPPTAFVQVNGDQLNRLSVFPDVSASMHCGEYVVKVSL